MNNKINSNPLNIEEQYQFYLKKSNMNEQSMGAVQRSEMRKAFMGGMSQMWIIMTRHISTLEEAHAVVSIEIIGKNLMDFWKTATKESNADI